MPGRRPGEAVAVHWLRHAMFDAARDDGAAMRLVQWLEPTAVTLVEEERAHGADDAAGGGHGRFLYRNKKFTFLSEIILLQYELPCLTRLNFDDEQINSAEASTFMASVGECGCGEAASTGEPGDGEAAVAGERGGGWGVAAPTTLRRSGSSSSVASCAGGAERRGKRSRGEGAWRASGGRASSSEQRLG
uniref:Uncharacterized protein n=1 Tax=Oryza meridionalis TaxID=40149 RepID=A0A0E0CM75_9ORYZ